MKLTTSDQFIRKATEAVYNMVVEGFDPTDIVKFTPDDVYVVASTYVLGNQKAQLSTTLPDGKYYEVTYNHEKGEMYVDCYVRLKQNVIR